LLLRIWKCVRHCWVSYVKSIIAIEYNEQLLENYGDTLLNKITVSNHTMHLPTPKSTRYSFRSVGHGLSVKSELGLHKKHSLIARYYITNNINCFIYHCGVSYRFSYHFVFYNFYCKLLSFMGMSWCRPIF